MENKFDNLDDVVSQIYIFESKFTLELVKYLNNKKSDPDLLNIMSYKEQNVLGNKKSIISFKKATPVKEELKFVVWRDYRFIDVYIFTESDDHHFGIYDESNYFNISATLYNLERKYLCAIQEKEKDRLGQETLKVLANVQTCYEIIKDLNNAD